MSEVTEWRNPPHRPSLYEERYCEMLIDHMSQGLSFESFAGRLRVSVSTIKNWRDKHPDFMSAFKIGKAASQFFFEKEGLKGLWTHSEKETDSDGTSRSVSTSMNAAVYKLMMANHFKWTDRVQDDQDDRPQLDVRIDLSALKEAKRIDPAFQDVKPTPEIDWDAE